LIVSSSPNQYHLHRMIKALFLIFEPGPTWERIAEAGRGLAFIIVVYLLPMWLMVATAEGFGLMHWGTSQMNYGVIKKLTVNEVVLFETARSLLMLLVIAISAGLIKWLGETFHSRQNYTQAFTVVAYGLSPLFLVQLLNVFPMPVWLVWAMGILLALSTIYHGVPSVMKVDPTHALGLYFMSSLVVVTLTGTERFFTAWYLSGHFAPLTNTVAQFAAKLPCSK
jgi:hypothetical protein